MSDYLTNLLIRTRYPERTIQPRLGSVFHPISPGSMGGDVGGEAPEEEPFPVGRVSQSVPRHGLSEGQSLQDIGDGPEVAGPSSEQDIQQRELPLESTVARERQDSSSEITSLSGPKGVTFEANPVPGQVQTKPENDGGIPSSHPPVPFSEQSRVQLSHASATEIAVRRDEVTSPAAPTRLGDEQRLATSRRNPSEDKAVSLLPIDRSIVGQEGTAASRKPTAQPASSPSRVPSDEANGSASSRTSTLIEELAREQSSIPLAGAESRPRDREPDNHVTARGGQIRASSSPRPLVGAPTVLGDGEPSPQARPSAAGSESERTISTSRRAAASEIPDLSALSLDPSLVSRAPAMKTGHTSRSIVPRKVENAPLTAASPEAQEELIGHSLVVPMSTKTFVAGRRAAAPRAAATVGRAMATDRVKPAEPVVQVTIGRVEVRAVAPPVRQEKGRKSQPAMSLDDYLKRRGGRSGG